LDFVDKLKELINHGNTLLNISTGCDGNWFFRTNHFICGCRLTFQDLFGTLLSLTQTSITQVGKQGQWTLSVKLYRHMNTPKNITLVSLMAKSYPLLLFPIRTDAFASGKPVMVLQHAYGEVTASHHHLQHFLETCTNESGPVHIGWL
jgi:hypothetical protein